jgi:predicted N-acyltransferase
MPWGRGWLNAGFYERVMTSMPEHVEVVAAERDGKVIAMAFNVASQKCLFGRYWGCAEEHPFLHFNVCLYHSIDECIARGALRFEGGAGGEHKLARGFEPSEVYGVHFFFEPRLDEAVRRHLARENRGLKEALARWKESAALLKQRGAAE